MKESFRVFGASVLLAVVSLSAMAAQTQPLDALSGVVEQFVRDAHPGAIRLEVVVSSIDPRLRLPACPEALQTRWAQGSPSLGRVTVQVRCEGTRPWRLHIQANASREMQVWALQRPVRAGEVLEASMLERQSLRAGTQGLRGLHYGEPVEALEPWEGFEFAQAGRPGQILTDRLLKAPRWVNRGDKVRVVYQRDGVSIATVGVALSDATRNERVQVRNERSGKVFTTIVTGRSIVEIKQ